MSRLRPNHRPGGRGFTLVELMVVVVIITALTALALPSIVKQMRDRRTRQAAEEIASVYRQARLRALGRGSAVLVRYAKNSYETREAVLGGATPNCVQLPVANCGSRDWSEASTTSQRLNIWTLPEGITAEVYANKANGWSGKLGESVAATLDVCFTPMGRTLIRPGDGAQFETMPGVPLVRVSGAESFRLKRHVLIPPNGLARTDVAQ